MARTERFYNRQMAPASDRDKDRFAYFAARATLARALAELERITTGTWKEDLQVAAPRSSWPRPRSRASRSTSTG